MRGFECVCVSMLFVVGTRICVGVGVGVGVRVAERVRRTHARVHARARARTEAYASGTQGRRTPIERVLHRTCSVRAVGHRCDVGAAGTVESGQINVVVVILKCAEVSYRHLCLPLLKLDLRGAPVLRRGMRGQEKISQRVLARGPERAISRQARACVDGGSAAV